MKARLKYSIPADMSIKDAYELAEWKRKEERLKLSDAPKAKSIRDLYNIAVFKRAKKIRPRLHKVPVTFKKK